jgi:hypothetical protein
MLAATAAVLPQLAVTRWVGRPDLHSIDRRHLESEADDVARLIAKEVRKPIAGFTPKC